MRTRRNQKGVQEAIISTATAVVKALNTSNCQITQQSVQNICSPANTPQCSLITDQQLGVSPGKAVEISFHQLAMLKQLYEDQVLTEEELKEQKSDILYTLRKLN